MKHTFSWENGYINLTYQEEAEYKDYEKFCLYEDMIIVMLKLICWQEIESVKELSAKEFLNTFIC